MLAKFRSLVLMDRTIGLSLILMLAVSLVFLAASAPPAVAASKATGPQKITKALALLNAGKTKRASKLLSEAITKGSLTAPDLAKALYYRGVVLRRQGKPAQAIADFTSALWLKNGLSQTLRTQAAEQRIAAYSDANHGRMGSRQAAASSGNSTGITPPTRAPNRRATPHGRNAPRAATSNWQQRTTTSRNYNTASGRVQQATRSPVKPKTSGVAGFFSNLFGGGSKPKRVPVAAATRVPPYVPSTSSVPVNTGSIARVSAWNNRTAVTTAQQAKPRRFNSLKRRSKPVQTAALRGSTVAGRQTSTSRNAISRGSGARYHLILSPVRSETVAQVNAAKVRQRFASSLANRQPVIEKMQFGGATFYQVKIGPFASSASPGSICTQLKASGVDCLLAKH